MKPAISYWKILTVLIVFPAAYMLYSISPWSYSLFKDSDGSYFIPFFAGLTVIHWISFFICRWFVQSSGWNDSDAGYNLTRSSILKLVGIYLIIAIFILVFVEVVVNSAGIDTKRLSEIGDFFPKTNGQRLLFVITAFSAGFCEEYIYRGFGINALESRKVNKWLALFITSVSFTFIHGIIVFSRFPQYFVPGIIFGLLFLWKRTLSLPIMVHSLIDLSALLMVFLALK